MAPGAAVQQDPGRPLAAEILRLGQDIGPGAGEPPEGLRGPGRQLASGEGQTRARAE